MVNTCFWRKRIGCIRIACTQAERHFKERTRTHTERDVLSIWCERLYIESVKENHAVNKFYSEAQNERREASIWAERTWNTECASFCLLHDRTKRTENETSLLLNRLCIPWMCIDSCCFCYMDGCLMRSSTVSWISFHFDSLCVVYRFISIAKIFENSFPLLFDFFLIIALNREYIEKPRKCVWNNLTKLLSAPIILFYSSISDFSLSRKLFMKLTIGEWMRMSHFHNRDDSTVQCTAHRTNENGRFQEALPTFTVKRMPAMLLPPSRFIIWMRESIYLCIGVYFANALRIYVTLWALLVSLLHPNIHNVELRKLDFFSVLETLRNWA